MTSKTIGLAALAVAAVLTAGPALAAFDGFGQDIPLEAAAKQIVPEGYSVDFAEGVDRGASVSWSSAPDWKGALSKAVAGRGYTANFGGDSVVIRKGASAPRAAAAPRSAPAREARSTRRSAPKASQRRVEVETISDERGSGGFKISTYRRGTPADAEGFRPYAGKASKDGGESSGARSGYSVREGDTLRNALGAWAERAGWKIVWNSEFDYPITADASFGGDFVEAATALSHAMSSARPALNFDFYKGNRTLVVANGGADEAN